MLNRRYIFAIDYECERPAIVAKHFIHAIADGLENRLYRVTAVGRRIVFRYKGLVGNTWVRTYLSRGLVVVDQTPQGIRLHGCLSRSRLICLTCCCAAFGVLAAALGLFVWVGFLFCSACVAILAPTMYFLERSEIRIFFRRRFNEAVQQASREKAAH